MVEISTLLTAVKPKDRTDQYKILAAMFALNAHSQSVTAAAISKLLKLHLGPKPTANLHASLRAYQAYVERTDQGPPILWRLTEKGLNHLRSLSGLSLPAASDADSYRSDIGIICALEYPELAAVIKSVGTAGWKEIGDGRYPHVYREASLRLGAAASLRVIATTSTSMGLTAAAIATTHLILLFRPRLIAMVGIAAGTRSGGKQFGDILVADPSVDYNSGKVVAAGDVREFQPDPYPIGLNPRLRSLLLKYRGTHTLLQEIRRRWNGAVPAAENALHIGPLGAADQVIEDATRVLEIQKNWRKLIGVEMETYGVYRAAHEAPEPKPRVVSFKAVCDFAAEKSDSWQGYASFMASEFAFEFLRREWSSLWPKT